VPRKWNDVLLSVLGLEQKIRLLCILRSTIIVQTFVFTYRVVIQMSIAHHENQFERVEFVYKLLRW